MGNLFEQKYPNNIRTINGLNNIPFQDDVVLECDTSAGAVSINLLDIPVNGGVGYWSTQYKLYIVDKSNNAGVNNITVNAPVGSKINGASSFVINSNGASLLIRVASNTNYVGQYSVIGGGGGITNLTATDSSTIDLTLTPILGGFNIKADSKIDDFCFAIKNLTTLATSYCKRTNQFGILLYGTLVGAFIIGETITGGTSGATATIVTNAFGTITYNTLVGVFVTGETITGGTSGATAVLTSAGKYENPFQSVSNGSFFTAFDTKTENGGCAGAFNLLTGEFTIPSTGWWYIQSQIGWALNSNPYMFNSDNPATLGQYWMAGANDIGSFSLTNYLVGSGLASVGLKTLTQGSSQLFVITNSLIKYNAGQVIKIVYTNNSDLEMFGGNNSNVIFRADKISN